MSTSFQLTRNSTPISNFKRDTDHLACCSDCVEQYRWTWVWWQPKMAPHNTNWPQKMPRVVLRENGDGSQFAHSMRRVTDPTSQTLELEKVYMVSFFAKKLTLICQHLDTNSFNSRRQLMKMIPLEIILFEMWLFS